MSSSGQIEFRLLGRGDLKQMHEAFNEAFSDYIIEFKLSFDDFKIKIIEKLNLDFEKSVGAYHEGRLVGFLFNTVGLYEQKVTAYNGGTGVIPNYRGLGITEHLYKYFLHVIEGKNIEQCILEVVTDNQRAINVYKKIGFVESKYYHCFRLNSGEFRPTEINRDIVIEEKNEYQWDLYESFMDNFPSFLDNREMLSRNRGYERLLEAYCNGECIGYSIFQPHNGRISQLGISKKLRGSKVGLTLVDQIYKRSKNKYLTFMNVGQRSYQLIEFLLLLGFENEIDQYEMTLPVF